MRTTVSIDDALLARAKMFAVRQGRTLNSVVEDALRELLERHAQQSAGARIDLVVYEGNGLVVSVDPNMHAALRDLDDAEDVDRYSGSHS